MENAQRTTQSARLGERLYQTAVAYKIVVTMKDTVC